MNEVLIIDGKAVVQNNQAVSLSLDNFGNATINDVAKGKTFTSSNGVKLTGTMPEIQQLDIGNSDINYSKDGFYFIGSSNELGHISAGNDVVGTFTSSVFGNATTADVALGKTFTSSNGLKLTGTAETSSSRILSNIYRGTYTPYYTELYLYGIPSQFLVDIAAQQLKGIIHSTLLWNPLLLSVLSEISQQSMPGTEDVTQGLIINLYNAIASSQNLENWIINFTIDQPNNLIIGEVYDVAENAIFLRDLTDIIDTTSEGRITLTDNFYGFIPQVFQNINITLGYQITIDTELGSLFIG